MNGKSPNAHNRCLKTLNSGIQSEGERILKATESIAHFLAGSSCLFGGVRSYAVSLVPDNLGYVLGRLRGGRRSLRPEKSEGGEYRSQKAEYCGPVS